MDKINKEEDLNLPYELRSVETHPRRPVDFEGGGEEILDVTWGRKLQGKLVGRASLAWWMDGGEFAKNLRSKAGPPRADVDETRDIMHSPAVRALDVDDSRTSLGT